MFLLAGAAALIWCAVLAADAVIAQRNARTMLETVVAVDRPPTAARREDGAAGPEAAPPRPAVHVSAAMAALSIPRVRLSAMVLHGSDARTLLRGPGHVEHTANPGETGNVVIAGHRDSFFRPLQDIRLGDDIFLDTPAGRFHYQVASLRVVDPREVDVLAPTAEEVLTLITCHPFRVIGHAPHRFIVRAVRVGSSPAAPLEARRVPLLDRLVAPALETSEANDEVPRVVEAPIDDEGRVRRAVARYALIQGEKSTCAVAISGDRATAMCEPDGPVSSARSQTGRTFSLERSTDAWVIRSIEVK